MLSATVCLILKDAVGPRHLLWLPLKMPMRNTSTDRNKYMTGSAEDQSAYLSELAGTIGVLATMAIIVKQFHQ